MEKKNIYEIFKEVIREHFIRREKLLSGLKLYRGQAPILLLLSERDGLTQKEIVENMKIKPSTVAIMIRRMKKRGLVITKRDEKDKRFSKVYLTDEGRKFICKLKKTYKQLEEECFGNFTEEERETLKNYLERIRDNLRILNEEKG
ncbi:MULTISPECIES: MarR family winged helix-turn-helix transcriptional regulator [Dictyoglomus]|jgi:DNA-binding MarR family transcriptional regulator|uniref:Transcriptional regulator, MarR family n=1 Tax=Dictyoglomus turgidum (strain DSM 6724 / Z-1310) TaxID=515635 RepID=B8DZJ2_DICTD|nr:MULTISPECIES: MarR family transcriptional regulator [Dictyoglomus]ACK41925.1 transcriptional regulator, MarR family [Dictyoglomus turgidum DSM 6724]PNV78719.1 MAG: MarR family transcriptional regulator [Dictyoglomus turgidum]HBU31515.1 MarR family transcriptional regulator [Dictyoglomus sp.]